MSPGLFQSITLDRVKRPLFVLVLRLAVRNLDPAYQAQGVLYLPEEARFSRLLNLPGERTGRRTIGKTEAA